METTNRWTIIRVSTPEQFAELAGPWEALLAAAHIENVFLTHTWLQVWWGVYGSKHELWTLVARDTSGAAAGIAPLVLKRAFGGARWLTFMGANEIQPAHLEFIIRPEVHAEVLRAFWAYLWEARDQWDMLSLEDLAADSPTRTGLVAHLQARGLRTEAALSARCPYAALPASFESYILERGGSTRHKLGQKRRNLARDCPGARFARVTTVEELERVFAALVELHQARWTKLGFRGSFASPLFTAFHRAMAYEALKRGWLWMCYLEIDGQLAAVDYCYRAGAWVGAYSSGFDERWTRHSVGMLLQVYAMEQALAEGAREVDFLQGGESYKDHWANSVRECWRVCAASPRWRGQLEWARMQVTRRAIAWAVKHIPRPTRRRIRRWLRLE